MSRDYSNIPAAVRDETLKSLRKSLEAATANAASHRKRAEDLQSAADQERHFAERDDERARQWKMQLDFAEAYAKAAAPRPLEDVDPETGRDYAEEAWQRREAEREGQEELAAEQAALSSTPLAVAFGAVGTKDDGIRADWEREMPDLAKDDPARLPVEHFDAAEAEDVRQIRREMAAEAGDDSELDQQIAEDDARAERAATGSDETWERNDEWTAKGEL